MKKRQVSGWLVAALLAAFVSSAVAQSATAYSSCAVGVIRKTLPAGKMVLVSIPLDIAAIDDDATIAFTNLPFISVFPNKSSANMWSTNSQTWISGVVSRGKWTGDITGAKLVPGESLFLKNGGTTDLEIVFSGSVPNDDEISLDIVSASRIQACANPYPVPFEFGASTLASNAVNNSSVSFWDVDNGKWISGNKSRGSWQSNVKSYSVSPAEGFLFKNGANGSSIDWVVKRPYSWPN